VLKRGVRNPCPVEELADEARFHVASAPARHRRPTERSGKLESGKLEKL